MNMKIFAFKAKILPAGETCIFVDFGEKIDMKINAHVQALRQALTEKPFEGLRELVPTYRSLSIYFDPVTVNLDALNERLNKTLSELANYNMLIHKLSLNLLFQLHFQFQLFYLFLGVHHL